MNLILGSVLCHTPVNLILGAPFWMNQVLGNDITSRVGGCSTTVPVAMNANMRTHCAQPGYHTWANSKPVEPVGFVAR